MPNESASMNKPENWKGQKKAGKDKCSLEQACNAPLCPLDTHIESTTWYPDEPVCTSRKFTGLIWKKNQRKLAKRTPNHSRYLTLKILNRNYRIKTGIEGLNPDSLYATEQRREQNWTSKHQPKKPLSQEEKRVFLNRMKRS